MGTQKINSTLYKNISSVINTARNIAYKTINFAMVQAYWNIGRLIVEEEQSGKERSNYGDFLIKTLSEKLTSEYGKGFTITNLKYMRQFYLSFPIGHSLSDQSLSLQKSHSLSDNSELKKTEIMNKLSYQFIINDSISKELNWTHYRLLLKVENSNAREFYVNEVIENNWSTRQLERQINSFYYERRLSSKNKIPVIKEAEITSRKLHPEDLIKDPYILEFLNLKANTKHLEKEIESALLDKLQEFLLELGRGFAFVERQQRISAENDNFYIDLVFYNHILKCFVLIDLKVGKLTHQDIGQMDMYVRMFEDLKKSIDDNPTIGIILCSEKNETVVKYSVLKENKQLFAAKYMLYLPTEEELQREIQKEVELIQIERKLNIEN